MSSRHIISEVVSAINVALRSRFITVLVKKTKIVLNLLNILYINGFIRGFLVKSLGILVYLKYVNSNSIINSLKIISRPGHRIFWSLPVLNTKFNFNTFAGIYVISTTKGLLTSTDCLLSTTRLSGEVLLKVEI